MMLWNEYLHSITDPGKRAGCMTTRSVLSFVTTTVNQRSYLDATNSLFASLNDIQTTVERRQCSVSAAAHKHGVVLFSDMTTKIKGHSTFPIRTTDGPALRSITASVSTRSFRSGLFQLSSMSRVRHSAIDGDLPTGLLGSCSCDATRVNVLTNSSHTSCTQTTPRHCRSMVQSIAWNDKSLRQSVGIGSVITECQAYH